MFYEYQLLIYKDLFLKAESRLIDYEIIGISI